ncbi:hypothetical protein VCHENC02_2332B, partial [Vibrio harveyi]
ADAICK